MRIGKSLPREARVVLAGDAMSSVGSGLTLPFLVVYLHQVRGVDIESAALAVSVLALAGLVGNPLAGSLSDRIGPRNALILGLVVAALGAAALSLVRDAPEGFAAAGLVGLGAAVVWPAQDSLLASLVKPAQRSRVFAIRYATMNAGLGVGSVAAAAIVELGSPASFVAVYLLDGATFLLFALILLLGISPGAGRAAPTGDSQAPASDCRGGYRAIIRDRSFVRVWFLTALLVAAGYAQCDAAFPAYATRAGGISVGDLALVNAANMITIVIAQLLVLRLAEGRRRTTALVLVCGFFALTWALTLAAGALGSGPVAVATFALAMVAFAIGEMLVSPTLPAIVNELAPESLRGRYNGVYVLAWSTGYVTGPAIAGLALAGGAGQALFVGLIGVCGLAALAATRLARCLPVSLNFVGREQPPMTELTPELALEGGVAG